MVLDPKLGSEIGTELTPRPFQSVRCAIGRDPESRGLTEMDPNNWFKIGPPLYYSF